MKKHLVGLIGAGEFGNFATSVFNLLPNFQLAGVVDTNEESAKKLASLYGARVFKNYKDLLNDSAIEIVMINTPNNHHAKMTKDALEKKKKVLCEKPLGISREELKSVGKTLEKTNGKLVVNYLLPRSNFYIKLREIIAKEALGKIRQISIENLATEATIRSDWYWNNKLSGGWFLTADIHFYDLLNFLICDTIKYVSSLEFFNKKKTAALFSFYRSDKIPIKIFHDFTTDYKKVDFTMKILFEKGEVTVKGWVPTKITITKGNKKTEILEKKDRELIYRELVAQNFQDLTKIDHKLSMENFKRVVQSSELAFLAQENRRKENYGKNKSKDRFSFNLSTEGMRAGDFYQSAS